MPSNGRYYQVIKCGSCTWSSAFAQASTYTLDAMQGYVVSIQGQTENDFLQKQVGADTWIAVTDESSYILDPTTGQPVFSYTSPFNVNANGDPSYITKSSTYAADPNTSFQKWYWVDGPYAGTQFSLGSSSDGSCTAYSTGASVNGQYSNWNGGEPNNCGRTEFYARFYAGNGHWNDLSATSTQSPYVVEFGDMPGDHLQDTLASSDETTVGTCLLVVGAVQAANGSYTNAGLDGAGALWLLSGRTVSRTLNGVSTSGSLSTVIPSFFWAFGMSVLEDGKVVMGLRGYNGGQLESIASDGTVTVVPGYQGPSDLHIVQIAASGLAVGIDDWGQIWTVQLPSAS